PGALAHVAGVADHDAAECVCQIPSRRHARVEVLVVLAAGRREDGALAPVDLRLLLRARMPEERIAGAVQDDDLGAGAVAVCLLVRASWKLANVNVYRVPRHAEAHDARAGAA